jgi:hypothetical protein
MVGFFIVGYGARNGFFGGGGADEAAAQMEPTPEPTQPPAAAAPSQPEVIEQYVYRDVYVSGQDSGTDSGGTSAPLPPRDSAPVPQTKPPAPTPTPAPQPTSQPAPESVEFVGDVTSVSGSAFTVDSHSGQFTVNLAPGASVHGGELEVGATVKVHGNQSADGSVLATEVEVTGGDD